MGDIHGDFNTYEYIIQKMLLKGNKKGMDCSLQLGDVGLGFFNINDNSELSNIGSQHKWIRGNHDNPSVCKKYKNNYLGDFGYHEKSGIFYISGGYSIDKKYRIPDYDWWEDEELNFHQLYEIIELYSRVKPRIVATHECPTIVKERVNTNPGKLEVTSVTEIILQNMFDVHKPEFWVFGHHHIRKDIKEHGTLFVALDTVQNGTYSDCIYEINNVNWS